MDNKNGREKAGTRSKAFYKQNYRIRHCGLQKKLINDERTANSTNNIPHRIHTNLKSNTVKLSSDRIIKEFFKH
jgi:hypothetical protein